MTDTSTTTEPTEAASPTTTASSGLGTQIVADIESAEAALAVLFPIVPVLAPYANILTAVLNATHIVAQDLGLEPTDAAVQQAVVNTLTPGQPGAAALN